ncbi:MAG TPA: ImmA/IrrE family metallo-endopeptidase [Vicinamibacterales bacterium]|nr:ImmA/IrrE family metallo-endopeptidase [Vicinamibacterales bacterium]
MLATEIRYIPHQTAPPGASLRAAIAKLGMTQAELADRTGLSLKHINQVIQGVAPLTHETALLLERATGVPARTWNALEASYRDSLARVQDRERLKSEAEWLKEIPVKELTERGYLPKNADRASLLERVCQFFGVANKDAWESVWRSPLASFRKSPTIESETGAVAAWLRIGELEATSIDCEPFDERRLREALHEVRTLTTAEPDHFVPRLVKLCAEAGVAVTFVPEIKGTRCWGAARWISPTKALIQLSLRYKTDDHLWFSLFHEVAHLLLHSKKETFITTDRFRTDAEKEADTFATHFLVPRQYDARLKELTLPEVRSFADEVGVAPGVVVGRLQKEGILKWSEGNSLKRRFEFVQS